jgi:hypothetical protein
LLARDDSGGMLNAWALDQLIKAEHFQRIIVEGDVKIYLASFNDISNEMQWKISTFYNDSKALTLNFNSYPFIWVCKEANGVAHAFAKFTSFQSHPFCCNKNFPFPWSLKLDLEIYLLFPFNEVIHI